jgi:hypothetical protein
MLFHVSLKICLSGKLFGIQEHEGIMTDGLLTFVKIGFSVSQYTFSLLIFGVSVVCCFAIGTLIAKRFETRSRFNDEYASQQLSMSLFSQLDLSSFSCSDVPADVLREAEVFMLYGKRQQASEMLESSMAKQLLTREQVVAFWNKYD